MQNNTFNLRRLAKWRAETERLFDGFGLRESQFVSEIGALTDMVTQKIIAEGTRFLFDFDEIGVTALSERSGKCQKTIYNWRTNALREKCKNATG